VRTRDQGSASVWLLTLGLVLLAAGLAGSAVGSAHVTRQQAQVAADLGALAGAVRAVEGRQVACGRAELVVSRNGGRLVACDLDGLDLIVTAQVPSRAGGTAGSSGLAATAVARAGPIRADDSRGGAGTPPAGPHSIGAEVDTGGPPWSCCIQARSGTSTSTATT
jgi:secretion/DNA translocation related TadE-like protein